MPGQFQSTIAVHHSHRESELVHSGHETASLPPTPLVWLRLGPFSVGAFRAGSKGTELFDAVPSTCHGLAVFADLLFLNVPRGDTISFGQYSWSPWMAYSDWVVAAFSFSVSNWVTCFLAGPGYIDQLACEEKICKPKNAHAREGRCFQSVLVT